jgi:serine protease Do
LIDAEGRLVGINTAIFSPSGGNVGIGFAVPVNLARSVMESLVQFGKVSRGFLGVNIQSLTPALAEDFNIPDQNGALVADVRPNTPGAKAGLKNGDVIRELNGKKINDSQQLRLLISQTAPGTKVTLKILRSDRDRKAVERTLTATLGTLPSEDGSIDGQPESESESASKQDSLDGVEVTQLDASARRQFNIPSNITGALVTSVDSESNSAAAGLRQGDIIVEINGQPVRGADDAVELSNNATGDRVRLRIWRAGAGGLYLTVDNTKRE